MEKKKILIAFYTQSGQVNDILSKMISPFEKDQNYELFYHEIKPVHAFPFPWSSDEFFDAFPESVLETGCPLVPMRKELLQSYDFIILGWQTWYLSPSIPITGFLKSDGFKQVAKNTPIITINACRNMWFMAHRSVLQYLKEAKAQLKGHLVLFDKHNNLVSVMTIMHWAFTARKDKKWGFLPKPGISDHDIEGAVKYGKIWKQYWENNQLEFLQQAFVKADGVIVQPHLMSMEHKAKRIFKIWTAFVLKKGAAGNPDRINRVRLFKYYLLFMIYFISPIATLIFYLTYPLFFSRIRKNIEFYQSV